MNDDNEKQVPADSWLNVVISPEGELTLWLWSEAELPLDFVEKLRDLGLVLELETTSPCG